MPKEPAITIAMEKDNLKEKTILQSLGAFRSGGTPYLLI